MDTPRDALYLVASGPTDQNAAWMRRLQPGQSFQSVPATLALGQDDDEVFGALTVARRRVRLPHPDHDRSSSVTGSVSSNRADSCWISVIRLRSRTSTRPWSDSSPTSGWVISRTALPFWPLGLPGWHDQVVALGLRDAEGELVTVWRRSGPTTARVPFARHAGVPLSVDAVYPTSLPTSVHWDAAAGELVLELPEEPAARMLRVRTAGTSGQAS
ncbi:hypothetical protein ACLKM7_08235 [Microbacterium sp. I2]|uniref:hypothetical protein n=1 Tax=Microbacterium sp. I2 TaxID=3391826 RepID=UPI003ED83FC4